MPNPKNMVWVELLEGTIVDGQYAPKGTQVETPRADANDLFRCKKAIPCAAPAPTADELPAMTRAELLAAADDLGISLDEKASKADVIAAITEATAEED